VPAMMIAVDETYTFSLNNFGPKAKQIMLQQ
jgi:hypothetical protein